MASLRQETNSAGVLKTLGEVAGLLAGAVALVYLAGGVVITLRLLFSDTNPEAVIGQLSREVLISVGLAEVVLPALIGGAIYAAYRLRGGSADRGPAVLRTTAPGSRGEPTRKRFAASALGLTVLLVLPGAISAIAHYGVTPKLLYLLIALAVAGTTVLMARKARLEIARTHPNEAWRGVRAVALMSLVVGATVVPAAIIFWASLPLPEARVCLSEASEPVDGLLIGETASRVYIAGPKFGEVREITSLPSASVERLVIGAGAADQPCPARSPPGQSESGAPTLWLGVIADPQAAAFAVFEGEPDP